MCHLQVDLLSVTFDPVTAEILLLILTLPLAAITFQPSKLATSVVSIPVGFLYVGLCLVSV